MSYKEQDVCYKKKRGTDTELWTLGKEWIRDGKNGGWRLRIKGKMGKRVIKREEVK